MKAKIKTVEELFVIIKDLKKRGNKVVSTSGCFDIIHAGHVTYLEEAKSKGDILVVLLNSDASVRGLKGDERPIVSQNERAIVLAGLESVDYVCVFDESTPCKMISILQPNSFIKGGDYRGTHIPEMDVMTPYGGEVEYVDYVSGCSTTEIIERVKGGIYGKKNVCFCSRQNRNCWKSCRSSTWNSCNRQFKAGHFC